MTREQIDALIAEAQALCDAATPGPWLRGPVEGHEWSRKEILCAHGAQALPYRILFTPNHWFESDADLAFVARARTLIPELVGALAAIAGGQPASGPPRGIVPKTVLPKGGEKR